MKYQVIPHGTVTSPNGFKASGMYSGIKKNARKYDVSLIVSDVPAVSAGTYTTNNVKAWPLYHNLKVQNHKTHRVIFANSGNANCFNGETGRKAVRVSLGLLSKLLSVKKEQIYLGSTGIIGRPFPVDVIKKAIPQLVENLSVEGGHDAARGILTTDTTTKEIAVKFHVDGKTATVAAMAKGAGMIYPTMNRDGKRSSLKGKHATMLCYMTTDLAISKKMLAKALETVVQKSFNKIAIDNDQSTNDMAIILANGQAGNPVITKKDERFNLFVEALEHICLYIARGLIRDGEGVTHVCEIRVTGAKNPADADKLCRVIGNSMLVKTMFAGSDPNWGRLMGCVGSSGVAFSPKLDILFEGVPILKNGIEVEENKNKLRQILKKKEFHLEVNLKKGKAEDRFWTTDLTKYYVWINSQYST